MQLKSWLGYCIRDFNKFNAGDNAMNVSDITMYSSYTKPVQASHEQGNGASVNKIKKQKSTDTLSISPESNLKLENLQAGKQHGESENNALSQLSQMLQGRGASTEGFAKLFS